MYKEFFQLKRNPFEITPDPSFLFPTQRHREALAALYYGVERRKGFVVLTGEVGTGKTMVVRCLLQMLHRAEITYAYVFNSRLNPDEFLQYIAADFGLTVSGKSKSDLLLQLSNFLISRYEKRQTTVLVVDEAHHASAEVLEEIRLLTNLETAQEKLLQILLVGQSELDEKLDSHDLRQLKQRIALRTALRALSLADTTGYIHKRLELAGAPEAVWKNLFSSAAVQQIFRYSRGYPRLINTICENALINTFARQLQQVPVDVIDEVVTDLRLDVLPSEPVVVKTSPPHRSEAQPALGRVELAEVRVPLRPEPATPSPTSATSTEERLKHAEKALAQLQDYVKTLRSNGSSSEHTLEPAGKGLSPTKTGGITTQS